MKRKRIPLGLNLKSPIAQEMNNIFKPKVVKAKKGKGSFKRKPRTNKDHSE